MRCYYLSDLHLEAQSFEPGLPHGDLLIIAGDLCHARCLDPARPDKYSQDQRTRAMRFLDVARERFGHVVLIAGNHEHYDGLFEETTMLLRRHLPGVVVLDDEAVEVGGVRVFGSTLWSDYEGRDPAAMDGARRRVGEFFFIKTTAGSETARKFRPEDALAAHDRALAALRVTLADRRPTIVVTHHAPSRLGADQRHADHGLIGAYASDLDRMISALDNVPVWIHGHTHVARSYRIGRTDVRSNAYGFVAKGQGVRGFTPKASFDISA